MRRTPLRRSTPLRSAPGPLRRTPLRPGPWRMPDGEVTRWDVGGFGNNAVQKIKVTVRAKG